MTLNNANTHSSFSNNENFRSSHSAYRRVIVEKFSFGNRNNVPYLTGSPKNTKHSQLTSNKQSYFYSKNNKNNIKCNNNVINKFSLFTFR